MKMDYGPIKCIRSGHMSGQRPAKSDYDLILSFTSKFN